MTGQGVRGEAMVAAAAPAIGVGGTDATVVRKRRTPLTDAWARLRRDRAALVGFALLTSMILLAMAAPLVAQHDPLDQELLKRMKPPSAEYLFGTDDLGRDVFSRVLYGGRISLRVGITAVILGTTIGALLGSVAGYAGGWVDSLISRAMEIVLAFPGTLLAIAVVAARGPGLENTLLAVGLVSVPVYARLMRGSVLSLREREFVTAARCLGASDRRILFSHILPNGLTPLIVQSTLGIAGAIVEAAALGFLGLGAQPPAPEWGAMLTDARNYLLNAPWAMIFPGLAIMLTVLGFNLFGDGLRDALDPQMKQ